MAYSVPTGTLFEKQSNRIQEILNKNIEVFLPALDPAWRETFVSAQGVVPASTLGRDLKIIKIYQGGMSGVFEPADGKGSFNLFGDATMTNVSDKLQTQSVSQTWPDPSEGPVARPYRLGCGLKASLSNLLLTMGEMSAEATDAFIGEIIAPKLEGHARLITQTLCNYWYLSENSSFQLCTMGSTNSQATASGNTQVTFNVSEYCIDRLAVGMRVDIYNGATRLNESGGVRRNAIVTKVDEVTNTVEVTVVGDVSTTYNGTGYAIHFANGRGYGIAGINSWVKNTGLLLGNDADSDTKNQIDVSKHPEFKSYFKGSVGILTEHKLRQYLRGFHRAKDKYGQTIDCLIASDGVWLNYEAQKIGMQTLDRTGRLSGVTSEGSSEGFKFTFDGRTYVGYTSNYIEDGVVYGLKKGGQNWKRIVPPSPKGTQRNEKVPPFIPFEFVGPVLGWPSIRVPIVRVSGSGGNALPTEGMQMPGMMRMQLVPDQPAGMKLTGVTTDRIYGD